MNSTRHDPERDLSTTGVASHQEDSVHTSMTGTHDKDSVTLRVATDWPAVENLLPVWKRWTNGLHTDADYFRQNLTNDPTSVCPYVISAWSGDSPLAILVGQIKERRASTTVAMVQIPGPRMRILEIVTKGRIGPPSSEVDALLATAVTKALRSNQAELAFFHRLPVDSVLYQSLLKVPGMAKRTRVAHLFPYSVVPLIAPQGERPAVFSGKIMREARRKTANLHRRFPGQLHFRIFSQPAELGEAFTDVERVNEGTWQSVLGADLTDPMQTVDSFRASAAKGWLRIFLLYVGEIPCAFLIGQLYGKRFYCEHAGYHRDFAKHSVGSVLTSMVLEHLASTAVEQVELGEGGQEHNRRLRCVETTEGTVLVCSPTIKGLKLNAFFAAAQASRTVGSWARKNLHLEWIGAAWREFLMERQAKLSTSGKSGRFIKSNDEARIAIAASKSDAQACG